MGKETAKKYAVIDIGTNTIKVKIAKANVHDAFEEILYKDFPSGLGTSLDKDSLIDVSGLQPCYDALKKIKIILSENNVHKYECIATHALRVARNQDLVINSIKLQIGIDVNVITGEEEVRLSMSVIMLDHPEQNNFAVINVGGGSTELGIHSNEKEQLFIFDFGAVNIFTKHFQEAGDNDSAISEVKKMITAAFKIKLSGAVPSISRVFSMGGSIINTGYILNKDKKRDFKKVNKLEIKESQLYSLIEMLRSSDESQIKKITGMDEQRAATLLPGILVHYTLLKLLNKSSLVVSTRSISDAILYKMILKDRE